MRCHTRCVFLLSLIAAIAVLAGCVAMPPAPITIETETIPWHLRVSGAHFVANTRLFYGIGKADGSRNMTLLRATAANHARKEMSQVLDEYVGELFQQAGVMQTLTAEEGEQMIGALVRKAVKRSVISDQWRSDSRTQIYVLCQLKLDVFKQVMASHVFDAQVRAVMMAEAENVHSALAGGQLRSQ